MTVCVIKLYSKSVTKLTIPAFRSRATNQKVVWFYVPVDKVLFMDCLYAGDLEEMKADLEASGTDQMSVSAPFVEPPCIRF
jgi:hypothetical protein